MSSTHTTNAMQVVSPLFRHRAYNQFNMSSEGVEIALLSNRTMKCYYCFMLDVWGAFAKVHWQSFKIKAPGLAHLPDHPGVYICQGVGRRRKKQHFCLFVVLHKVDGQLSSNTGRHSYTTSRQSIHSRLPFPSLMQVSCGGGRIYMASIAQRCRSSMSSSSSSFLAFSGENRQKTEVKNVWINWLHLLWFPDVILSDTPHRWQMLFAHKTNEIMSFYKIL